LSVAFTAGKECHSYYCNDLGLIVAHMVNVLVGTGIGGWNNEISAPSLGDPMVDEDSG